jgi:hypothetical protein
MVKVQLLTIDFIQINGPMKGHGDKHHASKTQVSHRQIPISIGDHEVRFCVGEKNQGERARK